MQVELICKQDGIIAGLEVYRRVFELLDPEDGGGVLLRRTATRWSRDSLWAE